MIILRNKYFSENENRKEEIKAGAHAGASVGNAVLAHYLSKDLGKRKLKGKIAYGAGAGLAAANAAYHAYKTGQSAGKIIEKKLTNGDKSFSMSNKKFEEKENEVISGYKKAGAHATGATLNGAIASYMTRHLVKKGAKNKKLAAAGMAIAAGNTGYHSYKATDIFEKTRKTAKDPEYQKKLDRVIEKQNKDDDKKLQRLEKKEAQIKQLKKELGLKK